MPLLTTKFYIPPARANLVPRPRLIERLVSGLRGPLTLISAPAGYGKTTIMSEWRAGVGRDVPVAWLSLDAGDNDLGRFLQYLSAALDQLQPGLVEVVGPLMQSSEQPNWEAVLTLIVNHLSGLEHDSVLTLDDCHQVVSSSIHSCLNFLLEHAPPRLHLVLLTRADPPLALARLRARGQLIEMRAEHLRFTTDEAAAFLNDVMRLGLSAHAVAALESRTDGWIAGLQLAALSLQRREDVDSFVSAFTGSYRYIADYLVEEVLDRQSETVKDFLLETSILDRMNAALCNAVTGRSDALSMLETLERSNLFLVPLDEERDWYRYHYLFADLLRARLGRLRAGQVSVLQCRASDWCAQHDLMEEAITYALRANDFERAAPLIEQFAATLSGQGRLATLSKWIGALPEAMIARRPRLGFYLAWALFFEYKFDQAEDRIYRVEQSLAPGEAPLFQGELALWHGIIARQKANLDRSRDFLLQALEYLPEENHSLRARAWIFLGLVYFEIDSSKASDAFIQACEMFEAENIITGLLPALYFLARTQTLQGRLGKAASTSQRALHIAEQISHWPVASYAHLARAELFYERNELDKAEQHIARGMELAELGGNADNLYIATRNASRLQRARGNWEKAQELIGKAEESARSPVSSAMVNVADEHVCLYLAQGKIDEAVEWLKQIDTPPEARSPIPWLHVQIIWARVRVARLEAQEALAELAALLEQARKLGLMRWVITIHCLQALALKNLGRTDEALSQLKPALALAEPEGFVRAFINEGPPMLELLHLAHKQGLAPGFVTRLVAAFAGQGSGKAVWPAPAQGILSQRELELLALIAAGHSNKEIANELVIAIGTVKRHTVNIYTKLEVKNRTEAVAKARQLGLL